VQPNGVTQPLAALVADLPERRRRSLPRGATIWGPSLFSGMHVVIEEGAAAMRRDRTVVDLLGPGDCFVVGHPEACCAVQQCEIVVLSPMVVLVVRMDQYLKHLARDPALASAAAWTSARKRNQLLDRIAGLSQPDLVRRVAAILALESRHVGGVCPLVSGRFLPIPQELLASICGVSRQSLNRALRKLQAARLVHVERRFVCVPDPEALEEAARGRRAITPTGRRTHCKLRHPDRPLDCARHPV
jgi:CRP-like cAMP-binding protein